MSNIKKKAEAIRKSLAPFLELAEALDAVAELSADEQRLSEASKEIDGLKSLILSLEKDRLDLQEEIKVLKDKKGAIEESAKAEGRRIVDAAIAKAHAVEAEEAAKLGAIVRDAMEKRDQANATASAAFEANKKLQEEIARGEKKLAEIREKISGILAGV